VSGAEVLRGLAEDCKRNVASVEAEHRQRVILGARPFLSGAMIALVRTGALDPRAAGQLLEELLQPIEQPLVDQGLLTHFTASFEAKTTVERIQRPDEAPER